MLIADLFMLLQRIVSLLLGVGMLSSSLFLLLIIVVYGLLWQQQNIHGWTVVGHTTSMFFTYIFVGLAHIMRIKLVHLVGTITCYVIGELNNNMMLANTGFQKFSYLIFQAFLPTSSSCLRFSG